MMTKRRWAATVAIGLALSACGGDDEPNLGDFGDLGGDSGLSQSDEEALEDFADAMNQAQGAGGGGTLTFDGTDHNIDSAVCVNGGGRIDIGTVGPDGFRVFVSGDPTDPSLQILSPEMVQWFDGDPFQQNKATVTIDGDTITASGGTWFNNGDDTLVNADFTIQCPNDIL